MRHDEPMATPAPTAPDLSVVIVTWNSAATIGRCLDALRAYPPPVSHEVIVVDNASSDDTLAVVQASCPDAHVIANATNRGLPAANNQGLARSRGGAVLVSNPDALVHEGAVAAMLDVLARRPRAGCVLPSFRFEDGRRQTTVGDLPTLGDALIGRQAARLRRSDGSSGRGGFWWHGWAHDEERQVGRGLEACYLVRRAAVDEVGPQDERFVLDWEGVDWMARFHEAGWEIWFTPAATVTHLGGASIRQVPVRWSIRSHLGMYRYFAKRVPRAAKPALAAAVAVRGAVKVSVAVAMRERIYEAAHQSFALDHDHDDD
jgi:GT2 family glycosyltransferase